MSARVSSFLFSVGEAWSSDCFIVRVYVFLRNILTVMNGLFGDKSYFCKKLRYESRFFSSNVIVQCVACNRLGTGFVSFGISYDDNHNR